MLEYTQYAAIHRPTQSTRYLYMHVVKSTHGRIVLSYILEESRTAISALETSGGVG